MLQCDRTIRSRIALRANGPNMTALTQPPFTDLVTQLRRFNLECIGIRSGSETIAVPEESAGPAAAGGTGLPSLARIETKLVRLASSWQGGQIVPGGQMESAASLLLEVQLQARQLERLQCAQNHLVWERVAEVNQLAKGLAALNRPSPSSNPECPANVRFQRLRLIERLEEILGPVKVWEEGEELTVSLSGRPLVHQGKHWPLSAVPLAKTATPWEDLCPTYQVFWSHETALVFSQGELFHLLHTRDLLIPSRLAGLHNLARLCVRHASLWHQDRAGLPLISPDELALLSREDWPARLDPIISQLRQLGL